MSKRQRSCLVSIAIGLILIFGGTLYITLQPAPIANLHRFAQMSSTNSSDLEAVRMALLHLVPVGTSEPMVYQFLQQNGSSCSPSDTYGDNRISCFIGEDQQLVDPLCKHVYNVQFILDSDSKLANITVGHAKMCF